MMIGLVSALSIAAWGCVEAGEGSAPEGTLSVLPASVRKGERVTISYTITDPDSDIAGYEISADYDGNGTVDETIPGAYAAPIAISRQMDIVGTARFRAIAMDMKGHSDSDLRDVQVDAIANQPPVIDLSSVSLDVTDGKTSVFTLPEPIDIDTPGPVNYTGVTITSGSENIQSATIDPATRKLTVVAKPVSEDKSYSLEVSAVSSDGGIGKTSKTSSVYNLFNISGRLESNEDPGNVKAGKLRMRDDVTDEILGDTTTGGIFNIQATKRISGPVKLRGTFSDADYVRTIYFNSDDVKKDQSGVILRVVPAPNFYLNPPTNTTPCTREDFRTFMEEINMSTYAAGDDKEVGLSKWDLSQFKGFEILRDNPNTAKGSYTTAQQDLIEAALMDPDGIRRMIKNKDLNGLVQKDNESSTKHYTIYGTNSVWPEAGYIIIVPNGLISGGATSNGYQDTLVNVGILNKSKIETSLMEGTVNDTLINHEVGHALLASRGHPSSAFKFVSIMPSSSRLNKPQVADIKAGNIVYEETYLPRETSANILGLVY